MTYSIALYGTRTAGFGFIASTADGRMFGDGEPRKAWTATTALWLALDTLDAVGAKMGAMVAVHQDVQGIPMVATFKLAGALPYYGDLKFTTGSPVAPTGYVVSAQDIIRASEQSEG